MLGLERRMKEHEKNMFSKGRGSRETQEPPQLCPRCELMAMAARHRAAPLSALDCLLEEFEQLLIAKNSIQVAPFMTWIWSPGGMLRGGILSAPQGILQP